MRNYHLKRKVETRIKPASEGNDLSKEEIEDLKIFKVLMNLNLSNKINFQSISMEADADGDGIITIEELSVNMKSLGKRYSRKKLQEIISSADEDGNGTLEFPEVVSLMERHTKKSRFLDEMRRAFQHFDQDEMDLYRQKSSEKLCKGWGSSWADWTF